MQLLPGQKVALVKADRNRHFLIFHHNQKTVQQIKIRLRLCRCKNHKRLIDVGNRRTDQGIFSRKNLLDISKHLLLIQDGNRHIIAHQRLDLLVAENSFCLTFINSGSRYVNVVESGNSFYNLSLHILIHYDSGVNW